MLPDAVRDLLQGLTEPLPRVLEGAPQAPKLGGGGVRDTQQLLDFLLAP